MNSQWLQRLKWLPIQARSAMLRARSVGLRRRTVNQSRDRESARNFYGKSA
jgi:hypothetical protein